MEKIVFVAMGGDSTEHDISVITGIQAFKNVDRTHYTPYIAYLKNGVFYTGKAAEDMKFFRNPDLKKLRPLMFSGNTAYCKTKFGLKKIGRVYSVLACFHGGVGEGGGAQGFFETLGIPQTSSGVFPSALLLDKCATKYALEHFGIPALEGIAVEKKDYLSGKIILADLIDKIGFPLIVKPARLGSSIGISVAHDAEELANAVDTAFLYDDSILAEPALSNYFELNVAVYRAPSGLVVSETERPVRREVILDFADKYLGGGGHGMESLKREIPANISDELRREAEHYTTLLYEVLDLKGVVRVDFLYDEDAKKLYLNEANTIPGSLAMYLFRNKRKSARRILTETIETSVKQYEERKKLVTSFSSSVLDKLPFSVKK